MERNREKLKIYEEVAKSRQTTHWDMDYLPTEAIDALYATGTKRKQRRKRMILLGCIILLVVVSGVLYFSYRYFFM
jgi:hypothetical protein